MQVTSQLLLQQIKPRIRAIIWGGGGFKDQFHDCIKRATFLCGLCSGISHLLIGTNILACHTFRAFSSFFQNLSKIHDSFLSHVSGMNHIYVCFYLCTLTVLQFFFWCRIKGGCWAPSQTKHLHLKNINKKSGANLEPFLFQHILLERWEICAAVYWNMCKHKCLWG